MDNQRLKIHQGIEDRFPIRWNVLGQKPNMINSENLINNTAVVLTSLTNDRFSLFVNNDEASELVVEYVESFELAYNNKNNLVCFVSDHSGVLEYFEILDSMQLLLYAYEEVIVFCDVDFTRFEERDKIICSAAKMKSFPENIYQKNALYHQEENSLARK